MCRVRFYFFPSVCSRVEREVIYVYDENLKKKEEKRLKVNKYNKIFINLHLYNKLFHFRIENVPKSKFM